MMESRYGEELTVWILQEAAGSGYCPYVQLFHSCFLIVAGGIPDAVLAQLPRRIYSAQLSLKSPFLSSLVGVKVGVKAGAKPQTQKSRIAPAFGNSLI